MPRYSFENLTIDGFRGLRSLRLDGLGLINVLVGETQARGIALKPQLKSARVIVDGSLLFSLLNATLDWALANAHAHIEYTIDYSHPAQVGLEVGLNPTAGSTGTRRLTFYIGFKKLGTGSSAHWVVNYWSPRYHPPVPLTQ